MENEPNIQFETDTETEGNSYKAVKFYSEASTPGIIKRVMKLTGVQSERQAEYLLLFFAFIMFASSIYFFFFFGKPSGSSGVNPPIMPGPNNIPGAQVLQ